MNYSDAAKIRKKSFGDLFAEKMVNGDGIGQSLKSTFSEKGKAKVKGIKEKFDPMNIAKMVGGKTGAAIYGKVMGRSQEDMEHFTETKKKKKGKDVDTAEKLGSLSKGNELLTSLMSIHDLLKKREEEDTKEREETKSFAAEQKEEKDRRHKHLLAAIAGKPIKDNKTDEFPSATKKEDETDNTSWLGAVPGLASVFRKNPARLETEVIKDAEKGLAKTGAEALEKGGAKAGVEIAEKTATKVGTEAIEKSAGKVLAKSLGKGIAKSIPFVGAAAGLGFAVSKLVDGDVVGAGLEAVGGLGSAITAIPATIASAARDVYNDVYGIYPEQDPNAGTRMDQITSIVKSMAEKMLSDRMKPVSSEDATKKTTTLATSSMSESSTPTSSTSVAPASSSTSVTPISSPNVGQQLNSVVATNQDAKLPQESKSDPTSVTTNNTKIVSGQANSKNPIPMVRNSEETFQRMLFNSTRVV